MVPPILTTAERKQKAEQKEREIETVIEEVVEFIPEEVAEKLTSKRAKAKLGKVLLPLEHSERIRAMRQAKWNYENSNTDVIAPLPFFKTILENEIASPTQPHTGSMNRQRKGKRPSFNDFNQREIDYDELEKKLANRKELTT